MLKIRYAGLFVILILIISCSGKKSKTEEMEKKEIVKVLSRASNWYKEKKHSYIFDYTDEEALDWNKTIKVWIKESNYFSSNFIKRLETEMDKDKHFGLYFYDYQDLGKMLKALCEEDDKEIIKELRKISDGKYRYLTYFSTVLNSIPDPNYDEKYLWMWETNDDGSRWYFSIVLIKENDKWVIDKFERWNTVLEE